MLTQLTNLNWIAILISFVVYFVLGGLWFTVFFAKAYKTSLGKGHETLQNKAPIFIVGPAICSMFIVIGTAILVYALNVQTVSSALELALVIGICYLVANTTTIAINPNIPRPLFYSLISSSYHLVSIIAATLIITLMR